MENVFDEQSLKTVSVICIDYLNSFLIELVLSYFSFISCHHHCKDWS
jgi:hypothetical protein